MSTTSSASAASQAVIEPRPEDGTGTNLVNPAWGSTGADLMRLAPSENGENGEMSGSDRPNARAISNAIFQQSGNTENAAGASDYLWIWGQFLDHDLSLTEAGQTETANIAVPTGDPFFDPFGTGQVEISFTRVDQHNGAYANEITAYIDASMIYGSDAATVASMRTDGGMLVMTEDAQLELEGVTLLTGDVRAAENIALSSMHTIFTREHNRIVEELAQANPGMSDDQLFDTARAHVEGMVQAITYNDFLPILIGEDQIAAYSGYDDTVNPGISAEFSTAVFRLGHTLLSSNLQMVSEDGETTNALALRDAFFRPSLLREEGLIEDVLRGAATQTAQAVDTMIVEDVRSFLFGPPGAGGFDLAALNIQRGRDLGIASYNNLREALGLARAEDFTDITSDAALAAELAITYGDVDLVDAWVGGLAEDPVDGALLGELFATVMIDQFTRLRDGDAYWTEGRAGLSEAEVEALWNTQLSDIVLRNTEVEAIQSDLFIAMDREFGDDGFDFIRGDSGNNFIYGAAGNDILKGKGGNDDLQGGDGRDSLYGGCGDDHLQGGAGDDRLFGCAEDDELEGGAGKDGLFGGLGDDHLFGDSGNDHLRGGHGNDVLHGGSGNDRMYGGKGDDTIVGGDGHDWIRGEKGDDVLTGGAGNDHFIVNAFSCGNDVITDFEVGADSLLLFNRVWFWTDYSEVDGDVVIDLGRGNSLTLEGLADDLSADTWAEVLL